MTDPAKTVDQNILPVQALFNLDNSFNTFIGQGQPFYATVNPSQSGLNITNSTIDSTTIGATTPSTGVFTNILSTTGQVTTAPSGNTDITNKAYVDAIAQGLNPKQAVKCATTANITLSGLQTIDGYTTLAGDRVLVKNESSAPTNGIYIAASGAWTRATDMDVWSEVPGAYCVVLNGTSNGNTGWVSTSADTGTINVTPITFVQFSGTGTYYAGTGLTLASNTFSITNVGTAGTYGSASAVPVLAINAQGQVTSATPTAIAIAASQVTSGTIASSLISGSYTGITGVGTLTAGTWNATPIANAYLANSAVTINGNSVSLGGSTTVTANTTNALTFNNGGAGDISGTTFNGSAAKTISYNSIGAPSTTGTNASGTWGISISGNAATVTNGLYSNGSYSNPSWLTSISGGIVSGAVASATLAASATNVAGGTAGALPYQTGAGATSFLGLGTTNYVLTAGATAPQYVAQSTLSVGSATSATTATNLAGGGAGYVPYQSGSGATSFLSAGTTGQVLTSNGSSAPTWTTPSASIAVSDDTTTNATRYPLFAAATTGSISTEYVSSTKYQFNPSTGVLTATGFSGSGSSLTSLTAGNLTGTIPSTVLGNSTVYIGTTAVALNRSSGSISLTGTSIDGNAGTATTATTATNATNTATTDDTSTNATMYPVWKTTTTGNLTQYVSSTKLQWNPSTGVYKAPIVNATTNVTFQDSSTQNTAATGFGFKNRIINGAMSTSQRTAVNTNVAVTTTTSGTFGPDRFSGYTGTSSLWNISQVSTSDYDFPYALRLQRIAGQTSTSAVYLRQVIETLNCKDLAGQAVTISFYVTAGSNYSGGAASFQVYTGTAADQGTASLNTAAWTGLASPLSSTFTPTTTRTKVTLTGTLGATVQEVAFGLNWSGSGTAGANDYIDITGVQLEKGSTATSFDYRPYGTELVLCQRYYTQETYTGLGGESAFSGNVTSGSPYYANTTFKVTMRTFPTVTLTNHTNLNFSTTVGAAYPSTSGFVENRSANATGAGYFFSTYTASAEL